MVLLWMITSSFTSLLRRAGQKGSSLFLLYLNNTKYICITNVKHGALGWCFCRTTYYNSKPHFWVVTIMHSSFSLSVCFFSYHFIFTFSTFTTDHHIYYPGELSTISLLHHVLAHPIFLWVSWVKWTALVPLGFLWNSGLTSHYNNKWCQKLIASCFTFLTTHFFRQEAPILWHCYISKYRKKVCA